MTLSEANCGSRAATATLYDFAETIRDGKTLVHERFFNGLLADQATHLKYG